MTVTANRLTADERQALCLHLRTAAKAMTAAGRVYWYSDRQLTKEEVAAADAMSQLGADLERQASDVK